MWTEDRGYFYGVLLGDGFFEIAPKHGSPYVMLKAIDEEFVNRWADTVERMTGKRYKVTKFDPNEAGRQRSPLFRCKCYVQDLVSEAYETTRAKTIVPNGILMADRAVKVAFLQGLMDSEGWISAQLRPMGASYIDLGFAVTSPWIKDVHGLFVELGVETTPVKTRKLKPMPGSTTERKPLNEIHINITDYVNAGLGFTAGRKAKRLSLCSRILNDYTRDYRIYETHRSRCKRPHPGIPVEDIV